MCCLEPSANACKKYLTIIPGENACCCCCDDVADDDSADEDGRLSLGEGGGALLVGLGDTWWVYEVHRTAIPKAEFLITGACRCCTPNADVATTTGHRAAGLFIIICQDSVFQRTVVSIKRFCFFFCVCVDHSEQHGVTLNFIVMLTLFLRALTQSCVKLTHDMFSLRWGRSVLATEQQIKEGASLLNRFPMYV